MTLEIISPADAVMLLIAQLQSSGLPANRLNPLLASLRAVAASFQRGNYNAGQHQLAVFDNKVAVQLSRSDPDLAQSLITTADLIADAVDSSDPGNCDPNSNDNSD